MHDYNLHRPDNYEDEKMSDSYNNIFKVNNIVDCLLKITILETSRIYKLYKVCEGNIIKILIHKLEKIYESKTNKTTTNRNESKNK